MADQRTTLTFIVQDNGTIGVFDQAGKKLDEMSDKAGRAEGRFGGLSKAIITLNQGIGLLTSTFSLAERGLNLFLQPIEKLDRLRELSQISGLSVRDLNALGSQARQSGSDIESFAQGASFFARKMAEAHDPTSKASQLFKAFGADAKVAKGDVGGALDAVARGIASLSSAQTQNAAAVELFGRGGRQTIVMLRDLAGAGGIAGVRTEVEKYTGVITDEAAAASDQFTDSLSLMKDAAEGLAITVVSQLLPGANSASEKVKEWIANNRELIAQNVVGWLNGISQAAETVPAKFQAIIDKLKPIIDLWNSLPDGVKQFMVAGVVAGGPGVAALAGAKAGQALDADPFGPGAGIKALVNYMIPLRGSDIKVNTDWSLSRSAEQRAAAFDPFAGWDQSRLAPGMPEPSAAVAKAAVAALRPAGSSTDAGLTGKVGDILGSDAKEKAQSAKEAAAEASRQAAAAAKEAEDDLKRLTEAEKIRYETARDAAKEQLDYDKTRKASISDQIADFARLQDVEKQHLEVQRDRVQNLIDLGPQLPGAAAELNAKLEQSNAQLARMPETARRFGEELKRSSSVVDDFGDILGKTVQSLISSGNDFSFIDVLAGAGKTAGANFAGQFTKEAFPAILDAAKGTGAALADAFASVGNTIKDVFSRVASDTKQNQQTTDGDTGGGLFGALGDVGKKFIHSEGVQKFLHPTDAKGNPISAGEQGFQGAVAGISAGLAERDKNNGKYGSAAGLIQATAAGAAAGPWGAVFAAGAYVATSGIRTAIARPDLATGVGYDIGTLALGNIAGLSDKETRLWSTVGTLGLSRVSSEFMQAVGLGKPNTYEHDFGANLNQILDKAKLPRTVNFRDEVYNRELPTLRARSGDSPAVQRVLNGSEAPEEFRDPLSDAFNLIVPSSNYKNRDDPRFIANAFTNQARAIGLSAKETKREILALFDSMGVNMISAVGAANKQLLQGELTQEKYNTGIKATIELLSDKLPAGVDAWMVAQESMDAQQKVSIINTDDYAESLKRQIEIFGQLEGAVKGGIGTGIRDYIDLKATAPKITAESSVDVIVKSVAIEKAAKQALALDIASSIRDGIRDALTAKIFDDITNGSVGKALTQAVADFVNGSGSLANVQRLSAQVFAQAQTKGAAAAAAIAPLYGQTSVSTLQNQAGDIRSFIEQASFNRLKPRQQLGRERERLTGIDAELADLRKDGITQDEVGRYNSLLTSRRSIGEFFVGQADQYGGRKGQSLFNEGTGILDTTAAQFDTLAAVQQQQLDQLILIAQHTAPRERRERGDSGGETHLHIHTTGKDATDHAVRVFGEMLNRPGVRRRVRDIAAGR